MEVGRRKTNPKFLRSPSKCEANNEFEILKKCQSPKTFIELDDSILKRIEFADPADDNAGLRKAKSIVDNVLDFHVIDGQSTKQGRSFGTGPKR